MSTKTYRFHELGSIAGVPGTFHAGQEVDIDEETGTVITTRLLPILAPNTVIVSGIDEQGSPVSEAIAIVSNTTSYSENTFQALVASLEEPPPTGSNEA